MLVWSLSVQMAKLSTILAVVLMVGEFMAAAGRLFHAAVVLEEKKCFLIPVASWICIFC